MLGPLSRILLRYVSAMLVTMGLLNSDLGNQLAGDADVLAVVQTTLGFIIMISVEGYYWLAKRRGWTT
jgi:hypothetical protein